MDEHESDNEEPPVLSEDEGLSDVQFMALDDSPEIPLVASDVKKGAWLLVKVKGGKRGATNFKYVACAKEDLDDDDGETLCQGFSSVNEAKTEFIATEGDIFHAKWDDLLTRLRDPKTILSATGRTVHVRFCGAVNVKEV